MDKQIRYQIIKGSAPVGEEHSLLRDAILAAASYNGHVARFVRDKHGFMCFFASRQPMPPTIEYLPAPCDAFRPWSPLKDEAEAEEHVARLIMESGWLHFRHKDLSVVTLTYENGTLVSLSDNAPADMMARLGDNAAPGT
ncbi:MAG: hypothetical protein LBM56_02975 [Burkholderiaceae bacterium]|jgi:hypothetical protein|nr:hypothetical protein [Burkholderiaceae bacterium]